ncbi:hypothetical protein JCM15519_04540 [Fundidesulfovibrio butyratiphilus]
MAMPIKPTPVLKDREAAAFEKRLSEQRATPLKVTCAPSLEAARKAIFGLGKQQSK